MLRQLQTKLKNSQTRITMATNWRFPSLPPPGKTKAPYKYVPTLLDKDDPDSVLNKSSFKGFFNLAVIFAITFLFTQPVVNWVEDGFFL